MNNIGSQLQQRLEKPRKPMVIYPEAMALREQRDNLLSDLRALLQTQQKQQRRKQQEDGKYDLYAAGGSSDVLDLADDIAPHPTSPTSIAQIGISMKTGGTPNAKQPSTISDMMDQESLIEPEVQAPAALPPRRKTHWDVVLEEMRWLATDFREERKWKVSSAKMLVLDSKSHPIISSADPTGSPSKSKAHSTPTRKRKEAIEQGKRKLVDDSVQEGTELTDSGHEDDKKSQVKRTRNDAIKEEPPMYPTTSPDDKTASMKTSRILSSIVSEMDLAIVNGGLLERDDRYHNEALEKFETTRASYLEDSTSTVQGRNSFKMIENGLDGDEDSNITDGDDPTMDEISNHIEQLAKSVKSRSKLTAKDFSKIFPSRKINLSSEEKSALEHIDRLWGAKPSPGAILCGPAASGKTFVASAILWKYREKGPHLVVCPPKMVIRWREELRHLSDLRVVVFGLNGGISSPDLENHPEELRSSDVVVCEYALLSNLQRMTKKESVDFESVAVDLRHPFALAESLGISLRETDGSHSSSGSKDIVSGTWWNSLIAMLMTTSSRCLLIEYATENGFSMSRYGLSAKEEIEILAKRAACIIGPQFFGSSVRSIVRNILLWARKKGKNDTGDKILRVKKVLKDAISPFFYVLNAPIVENDAIDWTIKSCQMAHIQREEYNCICAEIRGVLSAQMHYRPGGDLSCVPMVSNALLKLRRLFFFPFGPENTSSKFLQKQGTNEAFLFGMPRSLYLRCSPAQPDIERAKYILTRSGKLRELLSILLRTCGFGLPVEVQKDLDGIVGFISKKGTTQKKVAILAVLPEAQLLVSALLSCLGIRSELLLTQKLKLANKETVNADVSADSSVRSTVLWGQWQRILSSFSSLDEKNNDGRMAAVNIVIASPIDFGGLENGVGIESADVVISLDDDWSGRNRFIMNALINRTLARKSLLEEDVELIKLVCADSLEFNVYKNIENSYYPEELDIHGVIVPHGNHHERNPKSSKKNDQILPTSPLQSILEMRGQSFAKALSTLEPPPAFFGSGASILFLPPDEDQMEDSIDKDGDGLEIDLELDLMQREQNAAENLSSDWEQIASTSLILSTGTVSNSILTRQDLFTVPALMHLERPTFSSADASTGIQLSQLTESSTEIAGDCLDRTKRTTGPFAFLFYKHHPSAKVAEDATGAGRRLNAYAEVYSHTHDGTSRRDGNQGKESLVFFPPLFPLSRPHQRIKSVEALKESGRDSAGVPGATNDSGDNETLKRKAGGPLPLEGQVLSQGKRPRVQTDQSMADENGDSNPQIKNDTHDELQQQKSDAAGTEDSLLEEDFGLVGNGVMISRFESARFSAHDSNGFGGNVTPYRNISEDFVSCHIATDREESDPLMKHQMDTGLDSVLLFVKKRSQNSHGRGMPPSESLRHFSRTGDITAALTGPPTRYTVTDDSSKKGKKRPSQASVQMTGTAFTRLPGTSPASHNRTGPPFRYPRHRRLDFRHHLLQAYAKRHEKSGLALVESISFKVGTSRVGCRLQGRLEKLLWKSSMASGSGPGIPIESTVGSAVDDSINYLVKIVQEGSTRDTGFHQRLEARSGLLNSRSLSCRVDFGPFQAGFLASPNGVTQVGHALSRIGVSLPMGVKISQANTNAITGRQWTDNDSTRLEEAAKRFGSNWKLIARVLSGLEGILLFRWGDGNESIVHSVLKSSGQCRFEWHALLKLCPSLSKEILDSDGLYNQIANTNGAEDMTTERTGAKVIEKDGVSALFPSSVFKHDEVQLPADSTDVDMPEQKPATSDVASSDKSDESQEKDKSNNANPGSPKEDEAMQAVDESKKKVLSRSSFASVFAAAKKKVEMPIQIPGIPAGEPLGPPAPSHPSHMHSVQSSMTAQWAQGRTEMWPLQILDLADKQRAHAAQQRLDPPTGASRRHHPSNGAAPAHHPHHPQYNYQHHHHRQPSQQRRSASGQAPGPSYVPVQKSRAPGSGDKARSIERASSQQQKQAGPAASKTPHSYAQPATPAVKASAPASAPAASPSVKKETAPP